MKRQRFPITVASVFFGFRQCLWLSSKSRQKTPSFKASSGLYLSCQDNRVLATVYGPPQYLDPHPKSRKPQKPAPTRIPTSQKKSCFQFSGILAGAGFRAPICADMNHEELVVCSLTRYAHGFTLVFFQYTWRGYPCQVY